MSSTDRFIVAPERPRNCAKLSLWAAFDAIRRFPVLLETSLPDRFRVRHCVAAKAHAPLGDLFLAAQIFVILAVDCTHLLMPTRRTRRDSLVCGRSGLRPSPGLGDRLLEVLPHSPNQKC